MRNEQFMMETQPVLGKTSFTCPYCRTFAHQLWHVVVVSKIYDESDNPKELTRDDWIASQISGRDRANPEIFDLYNTMYDRVSAGEFFTTPGDRQGKQLGNAWVSLCEACKNPTLWKHNRIISPKPMLALPHADMPAAIAADFQEAAEIVDVSPRGACALLRLCIQKLCLELGYSSNLNTAIGQMVSKGLSIRVRQALDVVRVIGNNAVHPLEMDLTDDRSAAMTLFQLLNLIVENQIAEPKRINMIFDQLPEGARKSIEKRDTPKV